MRLKHLILVTVITGLLSLVGYSTVSASDSYPLRYFENYFNSNDGDDKYLFRIGYVDNSGESRIVNKTAEHVSEYITDSNKTTVSNIGWGENTEVVRPPYQTFDAGEKSPEVTTIGWSDFIHKHPGVKNSVQKVKWFETTNNATVSDGSDNTVLVIEFSYRGSLYRIYMPGSSLGLDNFKEDVSPSYTEPKLSFDDKGTMTYMRPPYSNYTQQSQSGTVVDK